MKIIYCTDIHDALKELRSLLKNTEADLYILSGDIVYKAFYDEDKIYQFVSLQEDFYSLAKKIDEKIYPFDLATDILRFPDKYKEFGDWSGRAEEYRNLFFMATKTMKEKYELIEEIIVKYSGADTYVLPGNYDIDFRYTALEHRNFHHKTFEFGGLLFAGYGGAPIATSGIPEKLSVVFHELYKDGVLYSEPEHFFLETEPDIILIHNPPFGYFDRVPGVGRVGSLGIRNYLDNHSPLLVASGHVHEDYGVWPKNGTLLMNPSNFGGVDSPTGWKSGGSFAEIRIENQSVEKVVLNRLIRSAFFPLIEIQYDGKTLVSRRTKQSEKHSHLSLEMCVRNSAGAQVG